MINRKKILIVGGTSELGQYLSNLFSKQKNEVYIAGRKFSSEKFSPDVKFFKTDILKPKSLNNFIKKIRNIDFDIVIHNIGGSLGLRDPLNKLEEFKKVWDFNFGYIIPINNILIPRMLKKKWGRIVHVSSGTAQYLSGGAAYSSVKSALNTYSQSLAKDFGQFNVIISAINPGPIRVKGKFLTKQEKKNTKMWKNFVEANLPIKRTAEIKEIGDVVEFLCSKKSSYCSGAVWNIDAMQK